MNFPNPNAKNDCLSSDISSLLQIQEKILLSLKKGAHYLPDSDEERLFLQKCNGLLKSEILSLTSIVRDLKPLSRQM